jgi:hypothetical protein
MVHEFLKSNCIDILAVTESWLTGDAVYDDMILGIAGGTEYGKLSVPRDHFKLAPASLTIHQ